MISNLLTALNERFMPFATFRHAVGKVLPSCWQGCAIGMANVCQRDGKALPIRWQNTISDTKRSPAASSLP